MMTAYGKTGTLDHTSRTCWTKAKDPGPFSAKTSIAPGEVHVWIAEPEAVDSTLLEACRELLCAQELDRAGRFHFEQHRKQFVVSHALVRAMLSHYAPVAPKDWEFVVGQYGQPELKSNPSTSRSIPRLRFSLSHTNWMTICAVTVGAEIGADVEYTERCGETVALADRFFAPSEVTALRGLPEPRQLERFFDYWTLKESYIKALGTGLHLPLDCFAMHVDCIERIFVGIGEQSSVSLSKGLAPTIAFYNGHVDEPESWRFVRLRPSERHIAALAVRVIGSMPIKILCRRVKGGQLVLPPGE